MGIFDFGDKREKRTQLYFRDDGKAEFRQLDIEATFMITTNKDDEIIKGWKHVYKNQFAFPGYKKLKPDMVTLAHGRDIIFDPFGLVPSTEKPDMTDMVVLPEEDEGGNKVRKIPQWLIDVGNAQMLKQMAQPGKQSSYNKIITFLGVGFVFEMLIIGALALLNRGGG